MYKIKQKKPYFIVVEEETDYEVFKSEDRKTARQMMRRLKSGYGFRGFTPSFFMQEYITND